MLRSSEVQPAAHILKVAFFKISVLFRGLRVGQSRFPSLGQVCISGQYANGASDQTVRSGGHDLTVRSGGPDLFLIHRWQVEHESAVPWQPGEPTLSCGASGTALTARQGKGLSRCVLQWGGVTSSAGGTSTSEGYKAIGEYQEEGSLDGERSGGQDSGAAEATQLIGEKAEKGPRCSVHLCHRTSWLE